jgi:hypothetical protein
MGCTLSHSYLVSTLLLLAGCQDGTKFTASSTGKKSFNPQKAAVDSTGASSGNTTLAIPCSGDTITAPKSTLLQNMTIPVACAKTDSNGETRKSISDMDVVFVLDTTGSMQPYVQLVRESFREIANAAHANGRKAFFAAISFGDTVLDARPLTENIDELLNATAESNPLWKPVEGGGGTAPEAGLLALETGLTLLGKGVNLSKTIVYLSDGPAKVSGDARDALASSFAIGGTAQKLRAFATRVQQQRGTFRLISATSCKRHDSWFSEWPTPCRQMQTLTQTAGVRHLLLPFPMPSFDYQMEFAETVDTASQTVSIECKLASVEILKAGSAEKSLPETKISSGSTGGLWTIPIEELGPGTYDATITRQCDGKASETKVSITVPQ